MNNLWTTQRGQLNQALDRERACVRPGGGNNRRFGKPWGKGGRRLDGGWRCGNGRPHPPLCAFLRTADPA
jgi:hypothetical protein